MRGIATMHHMPQRRDVLRGLGLLGAALWVGPRPARAQAGSPVFWVSVQASGGWDQALSCDPKPALRGPFLNRDLELYNVPTRDPDGVGIVRNPSASAVRTTPGDGITYLGFADFHGDPSDPTHPYRPFFPTYFDRITVFNGVDTATNNHSVGERYSASGSLNEGSPCFAAQVAGALGPALPLSFLATGGYAETAGLLPATPMRESLLPNLLSVVAPNDISGDNDGDDLFLPSSALASVRAAQTRRRARLRDVLRLPGHHRALDAVDRAAPGREQFGRLSFRSNNLDLQNMMRVGIEAARQGLAVSMNVTTSGFDSHEDNEQQQATALYNTYEMISFLIRESEQPAAGEAPVPMVALVSSEFGRTPHRTENGTDHWPPSTMLVIQNRPAQAMGFALPTNTTFGGTTDGDELTALRPLRLNPRTLRLDDRGVVLTPGHVLRVLRRMAGIAEHPRLAGFPLTVEGDLALG